MNTHFSYTRQETLPIEDDVWNYVIENAFSEFKMVKEKFYPDEK